MNVPPLPEIEHSVFTQLLSDGSSWPKKILLITDLSRDVDDLTLLCALIYLHQIGLIELVGVVTTHMVAGVRARVLRLLLKLFNVRHDIIAEGSDYPIGKEGDLELLDAYEEAHSLFGMSYEGLGLEGLDLKAFAMFRTPIEVIMNAIEDHPEGLYLFIAAPATDLARALYHNVGVFKRGNILGGYWQGQAFWDPKSGLLIPNKAAYNMSEDMRAGKVVFEETCHLFPWTLVGKWPPRQSPMFKEDFKSFAETGHKIGRYLLRAAEYGLTNFALRLPKVYSGIYAHGKTVDTDDPIKDAWYWSTPYDPTLMLALLFPEMFDAEHAGVHRLIGMCEEQPGIKDPAMLKALIMHTVYSSLTYSSTLLNEQVA